MKRQSTNKAKMELQCRIERAQERARRYVKPGNSLVDELISERRAEAESEMRELSQLRAKPTNRSK